MFLLNYVSPEKASSPIDEIYKAFPKEIGPPHPLQLMSASPEFLKCQFEILKYYTNNQRLSFLLLTAIRYMAANDCDYEYCIKFNKKILMAAGANKKELEAIIGDQDNAPLEDNERAMLKFVAKAIKTPDAVQEIDVEALRNLGWKDSDILDAVAHGAYMKGHSTLMRAFINKNTE
jgi:alkylhydroperoxidase family enzyme